MNTNEPCSCYVDNRKSDESQREWLKRVMCMPHWMQTDYYAAKTEAVNPPVQDLKCPDCEGPMVSRKGQYGTFWGCRKYPNCRGTRNEMGLSKEEARVARENERKGENDAALGDMQSDSSTILQDSHYRFKKN